MRSSAVGTVTFFALLGANCSCHSWLQKKNNLFLVFSNTFGM